MLENFSVRLSSLHFVCHSGCRVSEMELVGVLPSAEYEVWSMLLAFIHLLEEVLLLEEKQKCH